MRTNVLFLAALVGLSAGCSAPISMASDSAGADAGTTPDDAAVSPDSAPMTDAASAPDATSPPADAGPPPADWLSAGSTGSCASRAGRVFCWGRSFTSVVAPVPVEIPELAGAVRVALGDSHACAVLGDGRVLCAGENRGGQLGIDPRELERRDAFDVVPGAPLARAVAVSQGGSSACALARDGSVWCWGDDSLGQTGSPIPRHAPGSNAPQPTPARVEGVEDAVAIAMGQYHSCAVLADGRARCWGYDWFGALGRGAGYTGRAQYEPADVEGIDDAIDVATDGNGGCVLRTSGEVWCWGGQVYLYPGYDPSTDDDCSVVVTQVCWRAPRALALPAVTALRLGGGAGCVETDGAWSCFGRTEDGLVAGEGLSAGADLVLGIGHVCAAEPTGEVRCRGRGDRGQLGDGLSMNATDWVSPVLP